ncbi:Hsp70 family protein [Anaeromyxobacter terrae]|uniref:Hsp70 family protein n=1 Tax=Anaeromyxobacter terrae TaxID=2925406 RepID=UPI001F56D7C1|nr:Hsp70 family protein [Anaeromyxobacter sp. SG22]
MAEARYLVGVDLGTVNSALAAVDLAREGDLADAVEPFAIPQLVAPGEVRERRLLPSCAYLPGPELAPEETRLPWGERPVVVGELAREQGARVPGRLVTSAKSWLANPRADRTAPILPWGAPEGVPRLSPVRASALYLGHLRDAWDDRHPDAPLAAQELVLAVPASFDEVARELTLAAAREAGLPRVVLVEEPSAAFHDWASRHRAALAAAGAGEIADEVRPIARGGIVLVVDVGGGTTDLTLVRAELRDGRPAFTRLAVGDHLLLGGDNVDLALARAVEARLGERLDASRFASLVHACRLVKERLMAEGGPESLPVAVVGRGSRLVASAVSAEVSREEVRRVFLDGFLPRTGADERPRRAPRTAGLAELGLPYEPEPAIPRHVAAFLAAHAAEAGAKGGLARPDAILVNGGVFTPREVRDRLAAIVSSWFPGAPPVTVLASPALDLAVARGAAYAALVRRGIGLRIGGGSPRAFYVGIAAPEGERALCVVPRHLEEGSRVSVPRPFALALGRPVRFPLFASARARLERPGDVVDVTDDLVPLPPVETVLRGEGTVAGEVPVRLEAALTEIGTLELWCAATDRDARWKLEFSLRGLREAEGERPGGARAARSEVGQAPRNLDEARAQVELFYGKRAAVEKKEVKGLPRALEKLLGPREGWSTPLVRELWAALHAGRARRRRSADHERIWLQLTGYCLRPGFGAPLDPWRAGETWSVFGEGLQYQADPRAWAAWWVMWRRIAGGLDAAAQRRLFDALAPFIRPRDPRKPPPKVPGVKPEAADEMIRLLGALERVEPGRKVEAGEWLLARVEAESPGPHLLWSIGRLGARVPFHASAHLAVPAEAAAAWITRLLALSVSRRELVFPLAQLARRSGDRVRDVGEELRARVLAALAEGGAPAETVRAVREVAEATEEEEQRIFGESLPAGLRLVEEDPAA